MFNKSKYRIVGKFRLTLILFVYLLWAPFQASADILISESFNSAGLPATWTNTAIQGTQLWTFPNVPALSSPSGGYYAVFDDEALGAAITPNEAALETPSFDCSNRTSVYINYHHHWYGVESTFGYVEVSNNGGTSWTTVMTYEKLTRGSFAAPQDTTLDISALAALQSDVMVRFRYAENGFAGKYWAIDDIVIHASDDPGITDLISPAPLACAGSYTAAENVTVEITNHGHTTITTVPVECNVSGGTTATLTGTYIGSIAPGASVNYTFPATVDMSAEAVYTFEIYTNYTTDAYLFNDTLITALQSVVETYPYVADFNAGPAGWFASGNNAPANNGRNFSHGAIPYLNGPQGEGASWYVESQGLNSSTYIWVESPVFDFTNNTNPTLSFDIKYALTNSDFFRVMYSIDGGVTWSQLGNGPSADWYNNTNDWRNSYTTPVDTWTRMQYELCQLSGEACVKFRIYGRPYYGLPSYPNYYPFAFDNFTIDEGEGDDIEPIEIILAGSGTCSAYSSNETIAVIIKNNTCRPLTNVPVDIEINGGGIISEIMPGPIPRFGNYTYTFTTTADLSAAGNHTIEVTTNLATDTMALNNQLTQTRTSGLSPVNVYPYLADFNTGNQGWVSRSSNGNDTRLFRNDSIPYLNGSQGEGNSWYVESTGLNSSTYIWVESPIFDFSALTNPQLTFDIKYALTNSDFYRVQYSLDGGATWSQLGNGSDPNWYNSTNDWRNSYTNPVDTWTQVQNDLCGLAGESCVKFRVYGRPYYGEPSYPTYYPFAFDNFEIKDGGDVGIVAYIDPVDVGCLFSANQQVTVEVYNYGCSPISNVPVTCEISGQVTQTLTGSVTGPIPSFGSVTYTFPGSFNMTATGQYNFNAYTSLAGDINSLNDSLADTIIVSQFKVTTYPYNEDFNSGPAYWEASGNNAPLNNGRNFVLGNIPYLNGPQGEADSWYVESNGLNSSTYIWVESPVFDFSNNTNPTLSFDIKYALTNSDFFRVMYSIDGGSSWNQLGNGPDAAWYNNTNDWRNSYTAPVDSWTRMERELCELSGEPCVKFRIYGRPYYGEPSYPNYYPFAFDNFSIDAGEPDDIQPIEFILSEAGTCGAFSSSETIAVVVKNNTCRPLYNVPIDLQIDGGPVISEVMPGPIPRFGNYTYTFTATGDLSATGTHTLEATTQLPTDTNATNDYLQQIRISGLSPIAAFPYLEDFNTDNGGWVSRTSNESRLFRHDTIPYLNGAQGEGKSWYVESEGLNSSTYIWVESPIFDLSALTSPQLSFDIKYALTNSDFYRVQYSLNGGATWVQLGNGTDPNWYNSTNDWRNAYTNPVDDWTQVQHDLCALAGESCVKFRIYGRPYYGEPSYPTYYPFAIDNIEIRDGVDAGVIAYIEPIDDGCLFTANQQVSVEVYNYGCTPLTNVPVQCDISGILTQTLSGVVPGPIPVGGSVIFTFPTTIDMTPIGNYYFDSYTQLVGDINSLNDSLADTIVVTQITINSFPYVEDFNSGAGYWEASGNNAPLNNGRNFVLGNIPYLNGPQGEGDSWYVESNGLNSSTYIWIESPVFDFSALSSPQLYFDIKYALTNSDFFRVQYSTNGGSTWTQLGNGSDPNWYNSTNDWRNSYTNPVDEWTAVQRDLCVLAGEPCVKIRVYGRPYYGEPSYPNYYPFAVDNFEIREGNDVGVTLYTSPVDDGCLFDIAQNVTVEVFNYSCQPLTNVPIECNVSGALTTTLTGTVPGPIAPGSSVLYTFPTTINMTGIGTYDFECHTEMLGDAKPSNDTAFTTVNVDQILIDTYPYFEDFNSGNGYWLASGNNAPLNNGRNFVLGNLPYLNGSQGNGDAWYVESNGLNSSTYIWVESPVFDFTSVVNPKLSFDIKYALTNSDFFRVIYSTNGGSTWSQLGNGSDPNWYNSTNDWRNAYLNPVDEWTRVERTLCSLIGESCVKFRIYGRPYYGEPSYPNYYPFAFDNIHITDSPLDAAVVYVDGCYGSQYNLEVTVENVDYMCLSPATINSIDIHYSIDGATTVSQTITGLNIAPGDVETILIPNVMVPSNSSSVVVSCSLPNGVVDQIWENDTMMTTSVSWQHCNDYCSNAVGLGIGSSTISQTSNATTTPGVDPPFPCGNPTLENTVWYFFETDSVGGEVTFTIENTICTPSSNGLQVSINEVTGAPCVPANYTNVFCANNGNVADITWGPVILPPNTLYYITIDGYAGNDCTFDVQLQGPISTLPVELTQFEGKCTDRGNILYWSTASESNSSHFELEKSLDGISYQNIATINAAGNSSVQNHYSYTDVSDYNGLTYYRLIQHDFDGSYEIYPAINLDCAESNLEATLYPNPTNDNSLLEITSDYNQEVLLVLSSNDGKMIWTKSIALEKGKNTVLLESDFLANGIYLLTLQLDNQKQTIKWSIVR